MRDILQQPLNLPCGVVISNRIVKAAMTEGLADPNGLPTSNLERLYGIWSDGGAGLLLSGNIQIDGQHLERPGNVIIQSKPDNILADRLKSWVREGVRNGNHFWAQISHAGRQTQTNINKNPKAPSPIRLALPGGQFGCPVALSSEEIEEIIQRFSIAAVACQQAGFTGIQIHAAHGYLISQFLSPLANVRTDHYGGTLDNRARILVHIIKSVRLAVGNSFPISVKLNSADFQKGGFNFRDSLQVAKWLEDIGTDVLEISGGTYEQPKLLGMEGVGEYEEQEISESTSQREAYFADFSNEMRKHLKIPILLTGGFRSRDAMTNAIESGATDLIGIGRPMCVLTDAPKRIFTGLKELPRYENRLAFFPSWLSFLLKFQSFKTIASFGIQFWFYAQLDTIGKKGREELELSPIRATFKILKLQRSWISKRKR